MRLSALAMALCTPAVALALSTPAPAPAPTIPVVQGVVSDSTGAIVAGAEVDLCDASGAITVSSHTDNNGSFQELPPHSGSFTLLISAPGFETVRRPLEIVLPAARSNALSTPLRIVLPIASLSTSVRVSAEANQDLTATDENHDSSVMTASELKALPIFDNDYASAMSAFLDDNSAATGGSGLLVDGVEANHATVSASAVQEVRINQDPYSAQYYYPGRGQMEIITKSAADHYHGQFNFLFRDNTLNAQNALAPTKPSEQRRVYEGNTTGPIPYVHKSSFLISFNRAEEDKDSVVSATLAPTTDNLTGAFHANVPSPTRETDFSLRTAHQFGERHSAYVQYSYEDWIGNQQGVGGQTLAAAAYNSRWHEDDLVMHVDSTLSASLFNQISLVAEHDYSRNRNVQEAARVSVSGDFTGGSAQNDALSSENNVRLYEMLTWTHGRHLIKMGAGMPHLSRRAYDDHTNELGTYTFSPTVASDGTTVVATALENYANSLPSAYTVNSGDIRFLYHQQEVGGFIQDQYKIADNFSITPGLRYDWQKFLADKRLGFSPRVSFAWVLNDESKTIVRGGGGLYYDRFGSGPLLELERYGQARRRTTILSLDPTTEPDTGCVPITNCVTLGTQPAAISELAPNVKTPYQIQYGVSVERQFGEHATGVISGYSSRGIHSFRSVDVNAPTAASGYTTRPDSEYGRIRQFQSSGFGVGNALDISFRGRLNKRFSGFGHYTWSHYESNQNGIWWFPQDQYNPNSEWSNSSWDRRHRLGFYAMFNPESIFNLSAGIFANSGAPWTVLTGTDAYGDDLYNTRPSGVGRNTRNYPAYADVDLRWGHDFAITGNKDEDAPRLGFSAGSFNLLNHPNASGVNQVVTSSTFGQVTSVSSARRVQLAMRLQF